MIAALMVAAAGFVFSFPENAAQWTVYCSVVVSAAVQPVFMILSGRKSRLFRVDISFVGVAYILLQYAVGVLLLIFGADVITAAAVVILLAALAFVGTVYTAERPDPDPTGMLFVSQLTEMMDTISRATAERDCGIHTQMLYEQTRFCEPSTDSSLRSHERKILKEICTMKPTDSDDEIAAKCGAVLQLLKERESESHGNI